VSPAPIAVSAPHERLIRDRPPFQLAHQGGVSTNGFYSPAALAELGLARFGDNVLIDRTVRIYGAELLELGSHVRIDAYSVISCGSAGISIGSHVHIGAFAFLAGEARIELHDFSGLSSRVSIYSSSDDYSGATLTNPMVPSGLRDVSEAPVTLGRHAVVGTGSVVLPGVTVGDGAAVGALSLVRRNVLDFSVVAGDGRVLGHRSRGLLELEQQVAA
jgi:dTDP-4-amino-4,6-dideoxy-D-glucose acyltransferase